MGTGFVLDPVRWVWSLRWETLLGTLPPRCGLERDERHVDEGTSPPPQPLPLPDTAPRQPAGAH